MKKRSKCRVAICQMRYSQLDLQNVARIKKFIALASRKKCDIVCFPEGCFHQSKQFELDHKFVKEIQEECKKAGIWAIVTDDFKIKKDYYNSALLIGRSGKLEGIYKKINLYDEEVKSGNKVGVFKTDFAKIGIAICWDIKFPELFKKMKQEGVQVVFCPTRWCYEYKVYDNKHNLREKKLLKSLIGARAFENFFFVCLANPVIPGKYFKDLVSYSAIFSPHRFVKEIYKKEGMLVADLDLNEIKKVEKVYSQR